MDLNFSKKARPVLGVSDWELFDERDFLVDALDVLNHTNLLTIVDFLVVV